MEGTKILDDLRYAPFGKCIYCSRTDDLRREHILPFGLSGTAILPDSTCGGCATITGRTEQKVLRASSMWPVRVFRDLKSRTKHNDAPDHYPLTVVKDGARLEIEVPLDDYPILLHFPNFSPPAFLDPAGYSNGIRLTGIKTILFGQPLEEIAKKLGVQSISPSNTQEPVAFARMIAKIAFAFAAAEDKLGRIKEASPVIPAILGETDDIGRWVGTLNDPPPGRRGRLHQILLHEDRQQGLLVGEVHLFSDSMAPSYGVILGELR